MKLLHKKNLYCWSKFDETRNIDFHSYLWVREHGNIVFDPLPLSHHDLDHLLSLGEVSYILVSNSDHVRDTEKLAATTGAKICGPSAEKDNFPIQCDFWLDQSSALVDDLEIYVLSGSKTEGELVFLIESNTLITGDLIRAHRGGALCLLPDAKLKDKASAIESVKAIGSIPSIDAILPGDGWPVFQNGGRVLQALINTL